MIRQLSILIPTRNYVCRRLLQTLRQEADTLPHLACEIIVADDASQQPQTTHLLRQAAEQYGCRFIGLTENLGRVGIRNLLAREATYPFLLFLDSDVLPEAPGFVMRYLASDADSVVYGGVRIPPTTDALRRNLRHRYEQSCAPKFTPERRMRHPYQSFRTCNFLVRRSVILSHPFDERISRYGYEDVLFGRTLQTFGIAIRHTDNPVLVCDFEENEPFLSKTDEALATLHLIRREAQGYSSILSLHHVLRRLGLLPLVGRLAQILIEPLRRHLVRHPRVVLYHLYRILRYTTLAKEGE